MKEATTDASGHNALSPQFSPNKANLTAPQLNEGMAFLANDLTGDHVSAAASLIGPNDNGKPDEPRAWRRVSSSPAPPTHARSSWPGACRVRDDALHPVLDFSPEEV